MYLHIYKILKVILIKLFFCTWALLNSRKVIEFPRCVVRALIGSNIAIPTTAELGRRFRIYGSDIFFTKCHFFMLPMRYSSTLKCDHIYFINMLKHSSLLFNFRSVRSVIRQLLLNWISDKNYLKFKIPSLAIRLIM